MDDFLNLLVKKSSISNNEYFNYRQPKKISKNPADSKKRDFLDIPSVNTYVAFDFETTGLNPNINNIVEIGAVKVIDGNVSGTFNKLINPNQYIPAYISSKIHITNKMVKDKEDIGRVMPEFIDFIAEYTLIAHNAAFDMSFLEVNAIKSGYTINNRTIDTLRLSRKYNKECKRHNLGYLTDFFGINLKNAHRAFCDAYATHLLYRLIREKYLMSC